MTFTTTDQAIALAQHFSTIKALSTKYANSGITFPSYDVMVQNLIEHTTPSETDYTEMHNTLARSGRVEVGSRCALYTALRYDGLIERRAIAQYIIEKLCCNDEFTMYERRPNEWRTTEPVERTTAEIGEYGWVRVDGQLNNIDHFYNEWLDAYATIELHPENRISIVLKLNCNGQGIKSGTIKEQAEEIFRDAFGPDVDITHLSQSESYTDQDGTVKRIVRKFVGWTIDEDSKWLGKGRSGLTLSNPAFDAKVMLDGRDGRCHCVVRNEYADKSTLLGALPSLKPMLEHLRRRNIGGTYESEMDYILLYTRPSSYNINRLIGTFAAVCQEFERDDALSGGFEIVFNATFRAIKLRAVVYVDSTDIKRCTAVRITLRDTQLPTPMVDDKPVSVEHRLLMELGAGFERENIGRIVAIMDDGIMQMSLPDPRKVTPIIGRLDAVCSEFDFNHKHSRGSDLVYDGTMGDIKFRWTYNQSAVVEVTLRGSTKRDAQIDDDEEGDDEEAFAEWAAQSQVQFTERQLLQELCSDLNRRGIGRAFELSEHYATVELHSTHHKTKRLVAAMEAVCSKFDHNKKKSDECTVYDGKFKDIKFRVTVDGDDIQEGFMNVQLRGTTKRDARKSGN